MADWPRVTVLIITYKRPAEIRQTLDALRAHLHYYGPLRWLIADDGTGGDYLEALRRDYPQLHLDVSVTQRGGWGANVNAALRRCQGDYVFLCEDDYVALRAIDLHRGVALLEQELLSIGCVRYDGLEGHSLFLELREVPTRLGVLSFLRLHEDSPCLNIYSNRPHLVHPRFHAHYGPYPEGFRLGQTEEMYAHTVKDKLRNPGGPAIVALPDGIARAFDHIGKSWQTTAEDQGRTS